MRRIIFVCIGLVFQSCASTYSFNETQISYIQEVQRTTSSFTIAKQAADDIIGRGRIFLGRYGNLPLEHCSEYLCRNFKPHTQDDGFGYEIIGTPDGDSLHVQVWCHYVPDREQLYSGTAAAWTSFNARSCALYMLSAKEPVPGLIGSTSNDMNSRLEAVFEAN